MNGELTAPSREGVSGSAGLRPVPGGGPGWHSRRYLPHFESAGVVQMLTFRLADALPSAALARLAAKESSPGYRRVKVEALLDAGYGSCYLARPDIAGIVQDALLYFDGERYRLLAWVIMPNHIHAIIEAIAPWTLASVVSSWKSFSAKEANKLLGRTGAVWQPEYFDRAIRDERHLRAAIEYIHQNPVRAGLAAQAEDWKCGSAFVEGPPARTGRRPALPEA